MVSMMNLLDSGRPLSLISTVIFREIIQKNLDARSVKIMDTKDSEDIPLQLCAFVW